MIISASRRTDIPACYADWFYRRIREGFVYVCNPMNPHRISHVSLSPDVVDGIVFWTKNPRPMMDRLHLLQDYMYYFQFTVTPYGKDMEPGVPGKGSEVIPTFAELSERIGPERVIWRYDPILLTDKYTVDYHLRYFEEMARRLAGHTRKCVISFVDDYRHLRHLSLQEIDGETMQFLAGRLSAVASQYGMTMESCAEQIDLAACGIRHGRCIDGELFERLLGCRLDLARDRNQREACGCMASIDIGMYDTCRNGCAYCYANHSGKTVAQRIAAHDPLSPILSGAVGEEDVVTRREMASCKNQQMGFL